MSYTIPIYIRYDGESHSGERVRLTDIESLEQDNEVAIATLTSIIPPSDTSRATVRYVVTDASGRRLRTYLKGGAWYFLIPRTVFPTGMTEAEKSAYIPGPITIRIKYVDKVPIWYYLHSDGGYVRDSSPVYAEPDAEFVLDRNGATGYSRMGTPVNRSTVNGSTTYSVYVRRTPVKVAYSIGSVPEPEPEPTGTEPTVYDVGEYMTDLTENTPTPERVEVEYSAGEVIRLTGIRLAKDIYPEATIEAMISSGGHVGLKYMPGLEVTCYIAENSDEVTLGEPSEEIYQSFADSYESGAPIIVPYDYEGYSESSGLEPGSFQLKYVPMGDDLYYVDLNLPEYSEAYSKLGFNIIAYESMEMNGMHLTARAALFNVRPGQLL